MRLQSDDRGRCVMTEVEDPGARHDRCGQLSGPHGQLPRTLPREQIRAISDLAHKHDTYISSGGWIETVLRYGPEAVEKYLAEAREVGFDVIEISTGFLSIPTSGLVRLVEQVKAAGLKAKPELGIQFGSGGGSTEAELAAEGKKDVGDLVDR